MATTKTTQKRTSVSKAAPKPKKRPTAKKLAAKKPAAKKPAAKKPTAKKPTTKSKASAKKPAARSATNKKVSKAKPRAASKSKGGTKKDAKKPAARARPQLKKVTRKAVATKVGAKKAASKKAPAKAARTAKKAAPKKAVSKKVPAKKAAAKPVAKAADKPAAKAPVKKKATRSRAKAEPAVVELLPPIIRTKSPYTKTQLRPMRKELLERRLRVLADLNLMGDEALRASDPDVDSDNVADHGSDAYERNLTLGLMEHDSRTLRKIEQALQLLQDGFYGSCSECSEPIPLMRLEALPFAANCIPCQEKQEGGF